MADRPAQDENRPTPAMIEAGAQVILEEVGGADLGGFFSAPDLAARVFAAMTHQQKLGHGQCGRYSPGGPRPYLDTSNIQPRGPVASRA